jgi:hypothetical protein
MEEIISKTKREIPNSLKIPDPSSALCKIRKPQHPKKVRLSLSPDMFVLAKFVNAGKNLYFLAPIDFWHPFENI